MTNPITGKQVKYYEIEIKEFEQQVYPNKKPAKLVGYDGISPGPTFIEEKGTETMVRFINHAKMANSVHLHGSYSVSIRPQGHIMRTLLTATACPFRRLGRGCHQAWRVQGLLLSQRPERPLDVVPRPCHRPHR